MFIARLNTNRTSPNYITLGPDDQHFTGISEDGWSKLIGNPHVVQLSGKESGPIERGEDGSITLRSIGHYSLNMGTIRAAKFPLLLSYSPLLIEAGQVSMPTTLVLPGQTFDLTLVLSTFKQVNLGDMKWIIQAMVIRVPQV